MSPRTLVSGMGTAIAAERGTAIHLLQIVTTGGTLRLATTPTNVSWNGTWVGSGGVL